jgi:hypothetical protein
MGYLKDTLLVDLLEREGDLARMPFALSNATKRRLKLGKAEML